MRRFLYALALFLAIPSVFAQGPTLPTPDHIVIVIEENKGFTDVIGSSSAPYINSLAAQGALLRKFFALHHPSQPNYIDFFAGDTLGVCDDTCPTSPFTAQNLGAALLAGGKTFTGFAEDLPHAHPSMVCKRGTFARKHCPWLDFSNVPASSTMDFTKFPQDAAGFATLPAVSFVIPNLENDMHNGVSIAAEVKRGDDWLKANLQAYATWAMSHNSLLVVTWDEDSSRHYTIHCPAVIATTPPANRIPTIVVGQPVRAGATSQKTYTHQDLLRTILDMEAIAPFGGATSATDITDIWQTSPPPSAAEAMFALPVGPGVPGSNTTTGCGDDLWKHVYHPFRLLVKQDCITVTGVIVDATAHHRADGVRHEPDGDTHGWLKVDPEFEDLLNHGNIAHEQGNLVFELVCHFPVLQPDARRPCRGFHDTTAIPPVGTRVAIRGTFVQDTNHGEWNEIHPVTSIETR